MQVLNRSENKFNGIIKNKVVLLLEALIKGKSLPLNQEIKTEFDKFVDATNKQSNCFKEKLQILFQGVVSKADE